MTLQEARSQVDEIVSASSDFQSSINSYQNELVAFGDSVNSVLNSVAGEIGEQNLVEYSNTTASGIATAINDSLSLANSALSTVSNDATNKIREIVDTYNNSLDSEKTSERLPYTEVHLSGSGGSVSSVSISSSKPSVRSNSNVDNTNYGSVVYGNNNYTNGTNNYSSLNNNIDNNIDNNIVGDNSVNDVNVDNDIVNDDSDNNIDVDNNDINNNSNVDNSDINNNTDSDVDNSNVDNTIVAGEEDIMDYYFELVGTSGVSSVNIPNWEEIMKEFLVKNELEYDITNLEFDGNLIKCRLFNGKVYTFKDISDKDEFLITIKELIKRERIR